MLWCICIHTHVDTHEQINKYIVTFILKRKKLKLGPVVDTSDSSGPARLTGSYFSCSQKVGGRIQVKEVDVDP